MSNHELVSIILPCRNEEKFIGLCLESIINNDFSEEDLEVLVIDGQSNDNTRSIVKSYAHRFPYIKLLDNPTKITPSAFNIGINSSKGNIIIIMGAHNMYPPNYISGLTYWLKKTGADCVGGLCQTKAVNNSVFAQAISLSISQPFGVGNAYFRIGSKSIRRVDTVAFGCYRREVFNKIGLFDEELVRNQDDEFNLRLKKQGGQILLVPKIISYYYARDSLSKLWRMYYQYGYFKPLVARKVGGIFTLRQLVPSLFVSSLLLTAIMSFWFPLMKTIFAIIGCSYLAMNIYFSSKAALDKGIKIGLALSLVFPVLHISYGVGYLKGIFDFWIWKKQSGGKDYERMPINR
jgi:glycosyltransferase involved in cell wall biosynthesis